MEFQFAKRMDALAPGIFQLLNEKKQKIEAAGRQVYNLSIGTPDFEPPAHVMQALYEAAQKPENENRIKRKQFSLSARLRKKLNAMRDLAKEKARRRKGRGIALLVGCVVPILFGAVLDELWHTWTNDAFAILGVGGMFAMIGAGVYEVTAAGAEKKAVDKLLKD